MDVDEYLQLLFKEVEAFAGTIQPTTIYLGGGTPSLLTATQIVTLFERLENAGLFKSPKEITIEVDPNAIDSERLEAYKELGIHRISLGAQSLNSTLLQNIGRGHKANDVRNAVELVKKYGFEFSLDLLFALPNQSHSDLSLDIDQILDLNPDHISAYILNLPEWHKWNSTRPSDEAQSKMFLLVNEKLKEHGYVRYEISNFSRPGKESKHNQLYWDNSPYLGLGLGAHSYLNSSDFGTRFWNPRTFPLYEKSISILEKNGVTKNLSHLDSKSYEKLTIYEALTEYCYTRLRTASGLSRNAMTKRFGGTVARFIHDLLSPHIKNGRITQIQGSYILTNQGILVSNEIFRDLTFPNGDGALTSILTNT